MYWFKDSRLSAGGHYWCSVRKQQKERERYDSDPLHRISKQLQHASYQRRRVLERMEKEWPVTGPRTK